MKWMIRVLVLVGSLLSNATAQSEPPGEAVIGNQASQAQPARQAADPAEAAACTTSLPNGTVFENAQHGYCLVHDVRWVVDAQDPGSVTIRIPPEGAPEGMALNISVSEAPTRDGAPSLDAVIDAFLENFFPQSPQFQNIEILERSDTMVAGQPAKFLSFDGNLLANGETLDIVGNLYVLLDSGERLYSLTFIMDTTSAPLEAYQPSIEIMRSSFTLIGTPQ